VKAWNFTKKTLIIPLSVSAALLILAMIVDGIARESASFAAAVNGGIGAVIRCVSASVTDILPFSLAELLIILSPLALTLVAVIAVKSLRRPEVAAGLVSTLAVCASAAYLLYVLSFGAGYKAPSLESYLPIERAEIDKDNLSSTLLILKDEAEKLLSEIEYSESGSSVYERDIEDISAEICAAYDKLIAEYDTLPIISMHTDAKPVFLSRGMSDFEILGVYTFFTGEANVNVYYPDYTLPFTLAHELAHQRGISRENEANFIAFLVCTRADDPYIRYSGYLNMYEYIASALSATDREAFREIYAATDARIRSEIIAYNEFYYANKNQLLAKLSDLVNDTYLKSQGTEGVISYGLVTRLCVSYYESLSGS
jgi:hypothetical protein